MKLSKSFFVLVIAINSINTSFGQAPKELREIIPPNPDAAQYQKYLGYPISPATGTANISIPLYTLQASGLAIPFSLSYHSSGIKVYDYPGKIGYGWSLFPGFSITRTIMGKPDDLAKTSEIRSESLYSGGSSVGIDQYLCNMADNSDFPISIPDASLGYRMDGQYDIFTVHLPNFNATFILKWANGVLTGVPIPAAPIAIKPIKVGSGTGPLYFSYFEVTDDKGYKYIFGKDYKDYSSNVWSSTSEWMLEKIIPPNGLDVVTFTYSNAWLPFNGALTNQYFEVDDAFNNAASGSYSKEDVFGTPTGGSNYSDLTYNTWSLLAIDFPAGRVDFNYESSDLSKISSIKVYNKSNENVKSIEFQSLTNSDYSTTNPTGLTNTLLGSVRISGEGQYSFEYDMQPFTYKHGQDFSGFYNGKNNSNLIPTVTLTINASMPGQGGGSYAQTFNGADRQPDSVKMQSHILKKIIYPTGGYSRFIYEPHKFISKGSLSYGLGLRVASTEVYDPVSGKTITSVYKYGVSESGIGELGTNFTVNGQLSSLDESAFVSGKQLLKLYPDETSGYMFSIRRRTISSSNKYSYFSFNLPVWYPEVNVYSDGGKTVYKYGYTPSYFLNNPGPSNTDNFYIREFRNLGLAGPKLLKKQIRRGDGKLIHENTYKYDEGGAGIFGLIVDPIVDYGGHTYGEIFSNYPQSVTSQNFINTASHPFNISDYMIVNGNDNVLSDTTRMYQDNGEVLQTITEYAYGYPNLLESKSVINSKNEMLTEKYYYPMNSNIPDIGVLSEGEQIAVAGLSGNNYLTTLIEEKRFKDGVALNSTLYGYRYDNLRPLSVYTSTAGTSFETRIRFHKYDAHFNILEQQKSNDVKEVYLWGYNSLYPVARIVGSKSYDEIIAQSGIDTAQLRTPVNDASLRTYLNALRLIDDVLVFTYTYKPLIGLTSETDPAGRTTYYEYDAFGRLSTVKDSHGNIVKHICYNYAGEVTNCDQ